MNTIIRRCTPDDLPVMTAFLTELYRSYQQDAHLDELPKRLSEFSLVAEKNGQVIGVVIAQKRPTRVCDKEIGLYAFPKDEYYLEVQDLFVQAEERGAGVGASLIREVIQRAKAAGIERSMVYSANADYVRIARFYERCGFKMWHIFMTQ